MVKSNTVLATIVKEKARVENSIEREGAIKKNVENTEAVLEHIAELVEANTPLPEDSNFASYEEWEREKELFLKLQSNNTKSLVEALERIDKRIGRIEEKLMKS